MTKLIRMAMATSLTFFSGISTAKTVGEKLEKKLSEKAAASNTKGSDHQKIMQAAIDAVKDLPKNTPKVGTKLPEFSLPTATGKVLKSADLSGKGKFLIVTFYRGGWCPYCNLQLRAFQEVIPEIKKRGGELVAISPESPDKTLSTTQKNELAYIVLSDKDNAYARKLGLVFELPKDLQEVYQKFGIDLPKTNGLGKWELPLSATYVINPKGDVIYSFVDADYKKRANIDHILAALPGKANSN